MPFGLNNETLEKINKTLSKYPEIDQAVIYGSRAKGNYKPGSDIDLTIKGKDLSLTKLNKICIEIDDLMLPYTFDLSIYHQIDNTDLIEHINRVGKIFYQKTKI